MWCEPKCILFYCQIISYNSLINVSVEALCILGYEVIWENCGFVSVSISINYTLNLEITWCWLINQRYQIPITLSVWNRRFHRRVAAEADRYRNKGLSQSLSVVIYKIIYTVIGYKMFICGYHNSQRICGNIFWARQISTGKVHFKFYGRHIAGNMMILFYKRQWRHNGQDEPNSPRQRVRCDGPKITELYEA